MASRGPVSGSNWEFWSSKPGERDDTGLDARVARQLGKPTREPGGMNFITFSSNKRKPGGKGNPDTGGVKNLGGRR